jgi:predicted DNA-binding transcriptional regulator AlpA
MNLSSQSKRGFNEEEASGYISMSRSFLRQSRMTGQLEGRIPGPPFIKVGSRAIRYLREDLDMWLEQFNKHQHTHQVFPKERCHDKR